MSQDNKVLFHCYLALLCWIPLPLASKSDLAQCFLVLLITLLSLFSCHAYLLSSSPLTATRAFRQATPVYVLFALYLLWQAFQLLPLPAEWVGLLSPIRMQSLSGYAEPSHLTISFHPGATWYRILLGLGYVQIFVLTLLLVNSSSRLKTLLFTLVTLAMIQSLYGAFMTLSGMEMQLWYKKEAHIGYATGTLLNRNHLANYLTYGVAAGIGLLLSYPTTSPLNTWRSRARSIVDWLLGSKGYIRLSLIIMVIGMILTRSRMGNTAFISSLTLAGLFWLILARKLNRTTLILFGSLLVIDLFLMGSWFGADKVIDRIENTNADRELRSQMLPYMQVMARDFWLVGSGAGTFADTFTQYKKTITSVWFNEAHCDYLQFLIENGVVGTALLALIVFLSFIKILQTIHLRHNRLLVATSFSLLMIFIAVSIHASVEYLLQRPATASLFIVFLALPWITSSLHSHHRKKSRTSATQDT